MSRDQIERLKELTNALVDIKFKKVKYENKINIQLEEIDKSNITIETIRQNLLQQNQKLLELLDIGNQLDIQHNSIMERIQHLYIDNPQGIVIGRSVDQSATDVAQVMSICPSDVLIGESPAESALNDSVKSRILKFKFDCERINKIVYKSTGIFAAGSNGQMVFWNKKFCRPIKTGTTKDIDNFYVNGNVILLYTASEFILVNIEQDSSLVNDFSPNKIIKISEHHNAAKVTLESGEIWEYNSYANSFSKFASYELDVQLTSVITRSKVTIGLSTEKRLYKSSRHSKGLEITNLKGCHQIHPFNSKEFVAVFSNRICGIQWTDMKIVMQTEINVPLTILSVDNSNLITLTVENTLEIFQSQNFSWVVLMRLSPGHSVTAVTVIGDTKMLAAVNKEIYQIQYQN